MLIIKNRKVELQVYCKQLLEFFLLWFRSAEGSTLTVNGCLCWTNFSFLGYCFLLASLPQLKRCWNRARRNCPWVNIIFLQLLFLYKWKIAKYLDDILNKNQFLSPNPAKKNKLNQLTSTDTLEVWFKTLLFGSLPAKLCSDSTAPWPSSAVSYNSQACYKKLSPDKPKRDFSIGLSC